MIDNLEPKTRKLMNEQEAVWPSRNRDGVGVSSLVASNGEPMGLAAISNGK